MHRSIEDQIHATYRSLRVGAAVMAFIFPIVLWYGGHHNGLPLRGAMSDYYWATHHVPCAHPQPTPEMPEVSPNCPETKNTEPAPPDAVSPALTLPAGVMRTWFVGLLFSIGVTLIVNQGHSRSENIFLTAAGLLAWCIALFPEQWDKYKAHLTVHIGSAVLFFICIAIVSAVFSRNTLSLVKPVRLRKHYQLAYNIIAGFMVLSPVTAMIISFFDDNSHYTFWVELCGVYAFAIYWCVKTREMSCPGAEKKVIDRQFHTPPPLIPGTKPPKQDPADEKSRLTLEDQAAYIRIETACVQQPLHGKLLWNQRSLPLYRGDHSPSQAKMSGPFGRQEIALVVVDIRSAPIVLSRDCGDSGQRRRLVHRAERSG